MNGPETWPALDTGGGRAWPPSLDYERGVWGKVHGMPSDFRWIARSGAFGEQSGIERQLNLGGEDLPAIFQAWRNLGDRCYAVACYPSRASDAAGRRGFLEKQILEWRRPAHVPAALGALLLLPYAASLSDDIWWSRYSGGPWSTPEFALPIHSADAEPLAIGVESISQKIQRGREVLQEAVGTASLMQLYDQLLSGRQPALLAGLRQPLPPEALAVLLLPLPRTIADQISLGGWIPSTRPPLQELGSRWHILAWSAEPANRDLEPPASNTARSMAEQLLAQQEPISSPPVLLEVAEDPPPPEPETVAVPFERPPDSPSIEVALPGPRFTLRLEEPGEGAPRILVELYEFARLSESRWLDPATLKRRCSGPIPRLDPRSASGRLLCTWVRQVAEQRPAHVHKVQWQVKVDLLRSAALVLAPAPSTLEAVKLPESGLVQALFFGLLLETQDQRDTLGTLGEKALRQVLAQSLACHATFKTKNVVPWIERWRIETKRRAPDIARLIEEAMAERSR